MAYQYKRRRPSIIRNFWVYRRLIGTAILLGLMLWFIWANDEPVTVAFPFGLGKLTSTTGIVILLSALVGSVMTILATTVFFAVRRLRSGAAPQDPHQPIRPVPGPAAAGLCRKNHGRLSQCSLVKLTKKDDGNPLLILSQCDRGTHLVTWNQCSHRTAIRHGRPRSPGTPRGPAVHAGRTRAVLAALACAGVDAASRAVRDDPRSSRAARRWAR